MAEASPLGRVLAIMKSNIDELSPILSKAAYVAVTSPFDISRKGAVVVLLEPAEGVVCVCEDAKLLLKCCCSSDIDPTGELSMGMGDIMAGLAQEQGLQGNKSVASAMPELARRCAAAGYFPAYQAARLGKVFAIYMKGVRWEKCSMSHVSSCAYVVSPSFQMMQLRPLDLPPLLRRPTALPWRPGMAGRGSGTASSRGLGDINFALCTFKRLLNCMLNVNSAGPSSTTRRASRWAWTSTSVIQTICSTMASSLSSKR